MAKHADQYVDATLEQSEVASTQAGAPNKTWIKARDKVVQHARDGRWLDLLSENIVKASMTHRTKGKLVLTVSKQ